jgi:hypothetical protein
MSAAGVDHSQISAILVSHFHPDHVWGLMEKGINRAVFPNAQLIVNGALASGSLRQPAIRHSAFLVTSGKDQLMVSNDTMYGPALLAPDCLRVRGYHSFALDLSSSIDNADRCQLQRHVQFPAFIPIDPSGPPILTHQRARRFPCAP